MATISRSTVSKPKRVTPLRFVSEDGLLSVKDWLALGDVKPRYELIDGKLVQKMTTTRKHTKAAGFFLVQCINWGTALGWQFFPEGTGVYINERTGFVPDVVGFKPGVELNPDAAIDGPPYLIVEVLSIGTKSKDRNQKKRGYAQIGIEIYIIIDPDAQTFEVYRLENNTYGAPETLKDAEIWQPAELPGLRLELSQLWM
jgi:Uma2 family endonuclease